MKRVLLLVFALLLAFSCTALADGKSYTLDEALELVDSGEPASDILLSDDFSHLRILKSGEFEPAGEGMLVLCRKAPLKEYETSEGPFPDDYEGKDLGEPEVYLCTEIMRRIPYELRAHSAAEAGDVLLVETMYMLGGTISSAVDGGSSLPSEKTLEAILNGEEEPDDTPEEERRFNYRPVFEGYILVSLQNLRTGGGDLIDFTDFPFSELRDNPELDDIWQSAKELAGMCVEIISEGTDPEILLSQAVRQDEADLEALQALTGDPESFIGLALTLVWEKAQDLADGDPEASELYEMVISEHSLAGLYYIAGMRGYSSVSLADSTIISNLLYIGVPDDSAVQAKLEEWADLLDVCSWDLPLLYSLMG